MVTDVAVDYSQKFNSFHCSEDIKGLVKKKTNHAKIQEAMMIYNCLRSSSASMKGKFVLVNLCENNLVAGLLPIFMLKPEQTISIRQEPLTVDLSTVQNHEVIVEDIRNTRIWSAKNVQRFFDTVSGKGVAVIASATGKNALDVVRFYSQIPTDDKYLILVIDGRGGVPALNSSIINDKLGPYLAWAYRLQSLYGGRIIVDKNCQSVNNAVWLGR